ncbi:hypothetical protein [Bifidobacterium biavatii]|uniref:Glycerophosphoryl diesterphosphodiesterase n=1 Tax=Bifidobacterium biavatii DSM 23969 TaxID=1437608 RepID=A0A086ZUX2_9BIFI|nr:hypothetical protein [Bifidobacterium biavatii]KFI50322.1 glycerophosphoryl diesterphosphodiesterase [Bifidobacterium biavatii DSM 23969]
MGIALTKEESLAFEDLQIEQDAQTKTEIADVAAGIHASAESQAAADAYCAELDAHHAWNKCFSGYINAAGYGYTYEPTMAVTIDGWDAHKAFRELDHTAQMLVVVRAFQSGHDIDRESGRNFLKHRCGIIIHDNAPF